MLLPVRNLTTNHIRVAICRGILIPAFAVMIVYREKQLSKSWRNGALVTGLVAATCPLALLLCLSLKSSGTSTAVSSSAVGHFWIAGFFLMYLAALWSKACIGTLWCCHSWWWEDLGWFVQGRGSWNERWAGGTASKMAIASNNETIWSKCCLNEKSDFKSEWKWILPFSSTIWVTKIFNVTRFPVVNWSLSFRFLRFLGCDTVLCKIHRLAFTACTAPAWLLLGCQYPVLHRTVSSGVVTPTWKVSAWFAHKNEGFYERIGREKDSVSDTVLVLKCSILRVRFEYTVNTRHTYIVNRIDRFASKL